MKNEVTVDEVSINNSYPSLSEQGKETTRIIIDKFKKDLEKTMNETLVSFTNNIADEIVDDDAWIDLRMKVINALCGYNQSREQKQAGSYLGQWWVKIRAKILEENREAIVTDILLDKEAEIKQLKDQIEYMKKNSH